MPYTYLTCNGCAIIKLDEFNQFRDNQSFTGYCIDAFENVQLSGQWNGALDPCNGFYRFERDWCQFIRKQRPQPFTWLH